jgi:hypothetical protein
VDAEAFGEGDAADGEGAAVSGLLLAVAAVAFDGPQALVALVQERSLRALTVGVSGPDCGEIQGKVRPPA